MKDPAGYEGYFADPKTTGAIDTAVSYAKSSASADEAQRWLSFPYIGDKPKS